MQLEHSRDAQRSRPTDRSSASCCTLWGPLRSGVSSAGPIAKAGLTRLDTFCRGTQKPPWAIGSEKDPDRYSSLAIWISERDRQNSPEWRCLEISVRRKRWSATALDKQMLHHTIVDRRFLAANSAAALANGVRA